MQSYAMSGLVGPIQTSDRKELMTDFILNWITSEV